MAFNLHIQCTFDYSLLVANLCLRWLFSLRKVQVAHIIYCDWLCNCCGYYVHVYPQSHWVQSFTTYPFRLSMVSQWSVYWNPILTLTLTNRFVVHLTPVLPSSSYRRPKDMNHKNKYIIIWRRKRDTTFIRRFLLHLCIHVLSCIARWNQEHRSSNHKSMKKKTQVVKILTCKET